MEKVDEEQLGIEHQRKFGVRHDFKGPGTKSTLIERLRKSCHLVV